MRATVQTRVVFFKPKDTIQLDQVCSDCIHISFQKGRLTKKAWVLTRDGEWIAIAPEDIITKMYRKLALEAVNTVKHIFSIPNSYSPKQRMILKKANYRPMKNFKKWETSN